MFNYQLLAVFKNNIFISYLCVLIFQIHYAYKLYRLYAFENYEYIVLWLHFELLLLLLCYSFIELLNLVYFCLRTFWFISCLYYDYLTYNNTATFIIVRKYITT